MKLARDLSPKDMKGFLCLDHSRFREETAWRCTKENVVVMLKGPEGVVVYRQVGDQNVTWTVKLSGDVPVALVRYAIKQAEVQP